MVAEIVLLGASLLLGLGAQRTWPSDAARRRAWNMFFWTVSPAVVFYAFTEVRVDRQLGLALAAAAVAAWLTVGLAYLYARRVAPDRSERGALTLAGGFGNTGFLGYTLAHLALGPAGLALVAVYDRLVYVVPGNAVTTAIARVHGQSTDDGGRLRAILVNPPLTAALAAVGLRLGGVDAGALAGPLGEAGGHLIGPIGFFLLGFNVPLEPARHGAAEIRRALGALVVRFAAAPLLLLAVGTVLGATIPTAFYLAAAMPCAFNAMILARVFDLRPRLVRLLVVGSTVPAVVVVILTAALAG